MRLNDKSSLPLPLLLLLLLLSLLLSLSSLFWLSFPQGICFCFCLCICICLSVCHSELRERTCCPPLFASISPKARHLELKGHASHG